VPEQPPKPAPDGSREPFSGRRADAGLGASGAGSGRIGRRLRALRDYGPGSGSWTAWLRSRGGRIGGPWERLPETARHRIAALVIVAAAAALVWFVLIPAAPCGLPGGDTCPPDDDAIALVPADALAYAHLDVDPDSEQFKAASGIAARVPLLSRLAAAGTARLAGVEFDFQRQVEPWAGGEIALAALPAGRNGQRVLMIESADDDAADAFAAELLGPKQSAESVAGTEVSLGPGGTAWALDDGFLLVGARTGVRAMLERDDSSLTDSAGAAVLDELPEHRVAYAYVSPDGARALLSSDGGGGVLDPFVDATATAGAAASLSADADGLELAIRSDLDPARAEASPGLFAALPRFEPELTAAIGPQSLAYVGLGDPGAGATALIDEARDGSPALVSAFRQATRELEAEAGVDLATDVVPLLGSEVALSLQPVAIGSEPTVPGVTPDVGTPYVSMIAGGVDPEAARRSLARLERPIELATTSDARKRTFETIQIAGVQARSLAISDAVDLTYASWDDRLVVATDPLGIEQARSLDGGLDESEQFRELTADMPEDVSLIAYLDLGGLLDLGEQAGLAVDPAYTTYAPDLRTLTAAALTVTGGDDRIATDLRIAVGPRLVPETDSFPLGGE
jgi:hypothetical protein